MVRDRDRHGSAEPPVQERPVQERWQTARPKKRLFGRIGNKALARVCHNVGGGLHAGVDIRRVLETESMRGSTRQRSEMARIRDQINGGDTLTGAMRAAGGYFPPLLIEMVEVGERTGRLERVFLKLGEHYDQLVKLKRNFLIGIAWPMIELFIAVLVIGLMIFILGMVTNGSEPPPITFFGLYGTRGLIIYSSIVAVIVAGIAGLIFAVKNELINIDPMIRLLMQVPGIGPGIKTLAISRMTWALAMATDTDIDPRKAIELSVRTTQNTYYTSQINTMQKVITRGGEMTDAFQQTNRFPDDFLDALQTGEVAGRISETMEIIAKEYEERAKLFYRMLTVAAGTLVFMVVGIVIIAMIFALFSQYLGMLNGLME
ncbi:MAG: type II secretion system F family protein [Pirellulaceae bacterium]|nr:type II secretion system F family protein [Pirellulaceae bacterium]